MSVEISEEAEQNRRDDGLRGKAAKIFVTLVHDGGVGGEDSAYGFFAFSFNFLTPPSVHPKQRI